MKELLKEALKKENINISTQKLDKLALFGEKLLWYNQTHNITGSKSKQSIVENIIDSLIPTTFINEPQTLLDVGTGAGFPGLILSIIWEKSQVTLAEPINKRAAFLRFISIELELKNVHIFKNRVELLQAKPFSLITSRAVTDTKLLLILTKNVSNDKTQYLFYKGSRVFDEILELKSKLKYDIVTRNKRNYLWIKPNDS